MAGQASSGRRLNQTEQMHHLSRINPPDMLHNMLKHLVPLLVHLNMTSLTHLLQMLQKHLLLLLHLSRFRRSTAMAAKLRRGCHIILG